MVAVELFRQMDNNLKTIAKMLELRTVVIHGTKSVVNGKMITVFLEPQVIKYNRSIFGKSLLVTFFNIFIF